MVERLIGAFQGARVVHAGQQGRADTDRDGHAGTRHRPGHHRLPDGRCLNRRVLWPHESWQVPLPDGVRHAEVSVPGHLNRAPVALRSSGVARLIVGAGQVDVTP